MNIYDDTRCTDCRVETNHLSRESGAEWYMVHDHVWEEATKNRPANFLCVGCLEQRINRILKPEDFAPVLLNLAPDESYARSKRLRNRLGPNFAENNLEVWTKQNVH